MDSTKIGKFICELRKEHNLNQLELAEKLNVSNKTVSKWETGRGTPDTEILIELSNLFNVSINEILLGERINKNNKKKLDNLSIEIMKETSKTLRRNIFISTSIIVCFIILFLGYYFINNYNSISVYKVNAKNKDFIINDGIIIFSKEKAYIKVGPIKAKSKMPIYKVSLYYEKNNEKNIIFTTGDGETISNLIINNFYNHRQLSRINDIFTHEEIKYIKENLYLEITLNDDSIHIIKLETEKDFTNTKLFR